MSRNSERHSRASPRSSSLMPRPLNLPSMLVSINPRWFSASVRIDLRARLENESAMARLLAARGFQYVVDADPVPVFAAHAAGTLAAVYSGFASIGDIPRFFSQGPDADQTCLGRIVVSAGGYREASDVKR